MSALQNYAKQNHYDLLSKFDSLKEFNSHFEQSMILHKDKFTKSEYIALKKLSKFAANFFGVAWCRIQKAVSGTHQDAMFGISRSTFERMLRKSKEINLITVIPQKRENKRQKHNVYVFNRLEELIVEKDEIVSISHTIDVPKDEKIEVPLTNNLLKLTKLKENNTYSQAKDVQSDNTVINFKENKTDYQKMKSMVSNLFDDKKIVYRMYGAWLAQTKNLISIVPSFDLALQATKILIGEVKRRRTLDLIALRNPVGYFNGILTQLINKLIEDELHRYTENWQQAMIEDGTAFEPVEHEDEPEVIEMSPVVSQERIDRAIIYLEQKRHQLLSEGNTKRENRHLRLMQYEDLLTHLVIVKTRNEIHSEIPF